jgi:hypothetical protein
VRRRPQHSPAQADGHGLSVAEFDHDLAQDLAHRAAQRDALDAGMVPDQVGDDV